MKELLWDLFCNTGKIEYYIKYKELVKGDNCERYKDRGNL